MVCKSRNGDGAIEAFDSDIGYRYSSICIDCCATDVDSVSVSVLGLTSAVHVVQCSVVGTKRNV